MKIVSFNVENLFDRAKIFNEDIAISNKINKTVAELNDLLAKAVYSVADKTKIIQLITHEVAAFVRNPAKLSLQHPKLRVVQGDVLDPASLAPAMQGQDAVLSALGHKKFLGPSKILSEGTANILRAMKSAGVNRFICESSLGIGSTAGRGGVIATLIVYPMILPFYSFDKLRQEKLIEESDLDWVIVRPAALTNGAARGQYHHGPKAGNYFLPVRISRADVAAFMLQQLTDDRYLGSAVGLCY